MTDILSAIFSDTNAVNTALLLIFAAIGYFALDLFVEWRRSVRDNNRKIQHHVHVVQRSALPLLHELRKHIILPDYKQNPDRLMSLCFRMVHFLASIRYFSKHTYHLEPSDELEAADYFLSNKIPMMLRGNLYKDRKIDTEAQEVLASAFSLDGDASPFDFTIIEFKKALNSNADFKDCCNALVRYLDYKDINIDGDIDIESPHWRTYATICHLFVYISDFYMNSAHLPTWEEYRIYCVNVVRAFGNDSKRAKRLYLYRPDDLSNGYMSTFTRYGYSSMRVIFHLGLSRLIRARGRRQSERHGIKEVRKSGLLWKETKRRSDYPYGADRSETRRALASRIWNV